MKRGFIHEVKAADIVPEDSRELIVMEYDR
jgi:hypothetical protein